jgi:hypothetical protein
MTRTWFARKTRSAPGSACGRALSSIRTASAPGATPIRARWRVDQPQKCSANAAKIGPEHHPERDSRTKASCPKSSSSAPENVGITISGGGPWAMALWVETRAERAVMVIVASRASSGTRADPVQLSPCLDTNSLQTSFRHT